MRRLRRKYGELGFYIPPPVGLNPFRPHGLVARARYVLRFARWHLDTALYDWAVPHPDRERVFMRS